MDYSKGKFREYLIEGEYEEEREGIFSKTFEDDEIIIEISVIFHEYYALLTVQELGTDKINHPRYTGRSREPIEQIAVDYDEWGDDLMRINRDWNNIRQHGCKFGEKKYRSSMWDTACDDISATASTFYT